MKEDFTGKKDGPTILFDPNFVLNSMKICEFVNESMEWARKLHNIAGKISLKLAYPEQRAEYMYSGIYFAQIFPIKEEECNHIEDEKHFYRDLVHETIGVAFGDYVCKGGLWSQVFKKNIQLAINREICRLTKLSAGIELIERL
ncbi:hypothetical protein A2662_02895 [Candidatus Giovannonibacteria bacterium RIFCSPHIGHO2_01_FULL_45_33]|nr:MAG: hypothetical protein A2662_02895 [Candidatus Giovannonibacteria bacterium RIFCSPHIGHO2_01_FULL_45_33]